MAAVIVAPATIAIVCDTCRTVTHREDVPDVTSLRARAARFGWEQGVDGADLLDICPRCAHVRARCEELTRAC